MSELGKLLRELRGKESLRDVAGRAGISHNYLSIIEKGIDPRSGAPVQPYPDTLRALAKAYNYSYASLLKLAGIIDWKKEAENEVNESYNRLPDDKKKIVDDLIKALLGEK